MPKSAYDVNRASKKVVFAQVHCYTNVGNPNLEKIAKEGGKYALNHIFKPQKSPTEGKEVAWK